jgi:DNA-binding MltR family transcriptional regulator
MIGLFACSHHRAEEKRPLDDTLTFTKNEYDEMRTYFSTDTLMQSGLLQAIHKKDSDAIQLQKLLETEFENRSESGIADSEIKAIIMSFQTMKSVKQKFGKIDSALAQMDAPNAQEVRLMTDSMLKKMKELQVELKEINEKH